MLVHTDIRPSKLQQYLIVMVLLLVIALVWLSGLDRLWASLVVVGVIGFGLLDWRHRGRQPSVIIWMAQQNRERWQLTLHNTASARLAKLNTAAESIIAPATLIHIMYLGIVLVVAFDVQHPAVTRTRMVIFKDQVTSQTWRRLRVLARLVG